MHAAVQDPYTGDQIAVYFLNKKDLTWRLQSSFFPPKPTSYKERWVWTWNQFKGREVKVKLLVSGRGRVKVPRANEFKEIKYAELHEDQEKITEAIERKQVVLTSTSLFDDFTRDIEKHPRLRKISPRNITLFFFELQEKAIRCERLETIFHKLMISATSKWEDFEIQFKIRKDFSSLDINGSAREVFEKLVARMKHTGSKKMRTKKGKKRAEKEQDFEKEKGKEQSRKDDAESEPVDMTIDSYGFSKRKREQEIGGGNGDGGISIIMGSHKLFVDEKRTKTHEKRTKTRVISGVVTNGSYGGESWRWYPMMARGGFQNDNFRGQGGFGGNVRSNFRGRGKYPVRGRGPVGQNNDFYHPLAH